MIRVTGIGAIEERLKRIEQSINHSPILLPVSAVDGAGGSVGSVTSVAGGVGITNNPEPIVGTGDVNLDIASLTTETTSASGDYLPFFDVSVASGTNYNDQRRITRANLLGANVESLRGLTLAAGGMLYATGVGTLAHLAAPASTGILRHDGSAPSWTTSTTVGHVLRMTAGGAAFGSIDLSDTDTVGSSVLPLANGGSGIAAASTTDLFNQLDPLTTRGDLLTRDGTNSIRLAIGTADQVLRTDGTDASWAKLVRANTGSNTGTGDVFVFQTAPTFVTSIITPIVYGSASSTGGLTLRANDDDFLGTIGLDSTQLWWDDIPDFTAGSTETKRVARFNATLTAAPTGTNGHILYGLVLDPTLTMTSSGSFPTFSLPQFIGYSFAPTITLNAHGVIRAVDGAGTYTNTAAPSIATFQLFAGTPTMQSQTANVQPYDPTIFISAPTLRYDVSSGTATSGTGHRGYVDQPTLVNVQAGGTFNTAAQGFVSLCTLTQTAGTLTVSSRRGFVFSDATGTGTLTTQIGLDIASLSKGTTNIGIRNASTTVDTPVTQAITAVGDTIPITATLVLLNNTSGSSKTLTSAPTMANGTNGQRITLLNISAQNVVIQDQGTLASSNLRLTTTTVTIAPRQSVSLVYSSDVGDWVQDGNLVTVI